MTTVRTLIEDSMSLIEELGAGQTASDEDTSYCLRQLAALIDSLSVSGNVIFTETTETFNTVAGTRDYTWGSGGDFNSVRPYRIRKATTTIGNVDYPIEPLEAEEWAEIGLKSVQGPIGAYYYNGNYPLSTVSFNLVPNIAYPVTFYSEKPITEFTSLNDVITMPPGYYRMLTTNLAVEIAPNFGKEASMTVKKNAVKSLNAIKSANTQNDKNLLRCDQALQPRRMGMTYPEFLAGQF